MRQYKEMVTKLLSLGWWHVKEVPACMPAMTGADFCLDLCESNLRAGPAQRAHTHRSLHSVGCPTH